jgi:hypothetical protein
MQRARHSCFCLLLLTLIALPRVAWGQADCSGFFPLRAGVAWEMSTYDGQQTQVSRSRYVLEEKSNANGIQTWQAQRLTHEERSGDTWSDSLDLVCDASGLGIGMHWYRGHVTHSEGIQVRYSSGVLRFPRNLAVGMRLPEAKLTMSSMQLNRELTGSTTRVYRRMVTGEASKTTPAGTFDCWVIDATVEYDMGDRKYVSQEKVWLSKGSGIVAIELRSKGKLISYTELTSITP